MDEIMMMQGTEVLAFAGFQEFASAADRTAVKIKEGFMEMGYLLKIARDTDILQGSEYRNHEEFAEKRYDLDKGTVSRYIRIVERFSVGGNSHILQDSYRNVGFAKLSLMLHLSDEVAEELMDKYSKAEVQMVKEEIEAEQAISDIELAIERAEMDTECQRESSMLELAVWQIGRDQPDLYRKLWYIKRSCPANELKAFMEAFAPEGYAIHMVRIPGTGKLMVSLLEDDSISVINVRSNEKEIFDIDELAVAVEAIINPSAESPEESYLKTYGEPLQDANEEKAEVAPVQPVKDKRKQSKVVKSKPSEKRTAAAVQPEPQKPEDEQLLGQMNVEDYPEVLPTNYQEIKEEPEDASDESSEAENGPNGAACGTNTDNQGSAGRNDGETPSDTRESSNETVYDDVVSGGIGTAGAAGESGKVLDLEQLSVASDALKNDIELWEDIRILKIRVEDQLTHLLAFAPDESDPEDLTKLENIQKAYNNAVSLAAAIERVLIKKQRETVPEEDLEA